MLKNYKERYKQEESELKMKVLAIDYDGVIVDSVLDSLFVSHNAYLELMGQTSKSIFGGEKFTFHNWQEIQEKYVYEIDYYRSLRPYIRVATDYGLIQKLLEEKRCIKNQQEFDEFRDTVKFDFKKFYKLFYEERKRLQEISFDDWLKLIPSYPEIVAGINQLVQDKVKVVVATSNRKEFITRVFHPNYYNIAVKEEDILDVTMGEDKSRQIEYIARTYKVEYENISFIDDQLSHLIQTRSLGISVYLAGWSYATEEQKEEAKFEGIPIIEEAVNFYTIIRKYMNL